MFLLLSILLPLKNAQWCLELSVNYIHSALKTGQERSIQTGPAMTPQRGHCGFPRSEHLHRSLCPHSSRTSCLQTQAIKTHSPGTFHGFSPSLEQKSNSTWRKAVIHGLAHSHGLPDRSMASLLFLQALLSQPPFRAFRRPPSFGRHRIHTLHCPLVHVPIHTLTAYLLHPTTTGAEAF